MSTVGAWKVKSEESLEFGGVETQLWSIQLSWPYQPVINSLPNNFKASVKLKWPPHWGNFGIYMEDFDFLLLQYIFFHKNKISLNEYISWFNRQSLSVCIVFQVPQLPQVRNTSAGLVRRRPRSARRRRLLDRRPRSSLPRALPRPLAAKSQTFQAPGERL